MVERENGVKEEANEDLEENLDSVEDVDSLESEELSFDSEEVSITDEQFSQLEEELAKEKEEKERYIDRLQRLQAEFSNYRKRVVKEKEQLTSRATKDFILELLPIIDNFERALSNSQNADKGFLEGVEMIHRQILTLLKKSGVEEIQTVGEEFDPNYHNAVMKEESKEYESGIIIEELQKGYAFDDVVIRPAMVKVAE
ncbi:nucleotide exchange factor GrpE [Halonatronum saccharophilum]|uniref:nucleotide exchange factor GrpE n=1 Tax=Halonatronum saccharophilum TaxID=150060 RepID=UPI00048619BB|nr:nucleotide exchange factor GrpE [Halonatronum saccharophilum]